MPRFLIITTFITLLNEVSGQIKITYEYKPEVIIVNTGIANGISTSSTEEFTEYSMYNAPAAILNGNVEYNWFAFKYGQFPESLLTNYVVIREDLPDYPRLIKGSSLSTGFDKVWIGSAGREKGKVISLITNRETSQNKISHFPVLAAETPSYFFASNQLTYRDLEPESKAVLDSTILNMFTKKLLSEVSSGKNEFNANWRGVVSFSDQDHQFKGLDFTTDGVEERATLGEYTEVFNRKIDSWAKSSFLVTEYDGNDYRITTNNQFKISLSRNYLRERTKKLKSSFRKEFFAETMKVDLNETILPKGVKMRYYATKVEINVNGISKSSEFEHLSKIMLPATYFFSPILSTVGSGYSRVTWSTTDSKIKTKGKVISGVCKTFLLTGLASYFVKDYYYRQYLLNPYEDNNNYSIANTSNKVFLASSILWAGCFAFDATITVKQMHKTLQDLKVIRKKIKL